MHRKAVYATAMKDSVEGWLLAKRWETFLEKPVPVWAQILMVPFFIAIALFSMAAVIIFLLRLCSWMATMKALLLPVFLIERAKEAVPVMIAGK
jgi:Ni/Fe-hydrogenase subunit HybB-like protein